MVLGVGLTKTRLQNSMRGLTLDEVGPLFLFLLNSQGTFHDAIRRRHRFQGYGGGILRKWRAWMDRILSLSLTEYVSDACQERLFLEGLYNPGGRTSLLAFVGDFAR